MVSRKIILDDRDPGARRAHLPRREPHQLRPARGRRLRRPTPPGRPGRDADPPLRARRPAARPGSLDGGDQPIVHALTGDSTRAQSLTHAAALFFHTSCGRRQGGGVMALSAPRVGLADRAASNRCRRASTLPTIIHRHAQDAGIATHVAGRHLAVSSQSLSTDRRMRDRLSKRQ